MTIKAVIDLDIYQGGFDDYRDEAEELSKAKGMPVRFSWRGFTYTIDFTGAA